LEENKETNKNLATLSKAIVLLQAKVRTAQENGNAEQAVSLAEELEQAKQEEKNMR
jgi:hypothetical protein